jgi:hypothetical protein
MVMRPLLSLLAALAAVFFLCSPSFAEPDAARVAADRLVAAMGGEAPWSTARSLTIRARHWEAEYDQPYMNLIVMALDEPRMRFEGDGAGMKRRRAVVGDKGWRVSERSPLGPMTPEQVKGDLDWWEAHAYRTIARLARRDPSLSLRLASDGRLEVLRADGSRLAWYRLNAAGEPIAFGANANETGTVFGPLVARAGGVKLPAWVASASGAFRAELIEAGVSGSPPNADFDKP